MLLLSTSEVDMEARDNMGRDLGTMIRYSTVQYSTVQYRTVHYSTVQYSTSSTSVFEIHCCYSAERVGECHRRRSWRWKT